MKNQPYHLNFKSALVLTFLFSSIQGCAGEAVKSAEATTGVQVIQTTDVAETVFKVVTGASHAYSINDKENPAITLKRGVTYTFELKATGHPFWIKSKNSTGVDNAYTNGITGNGLERGTLTFAVPSDAPALLHYNCQVHDMMNGAINIID